MQFFESPWFLCPYESWEIPRLVVFIDVDGNLCPARSDAIVWIVFLGLLKWWKLRIECLWDLKEERHSTLSSFFDVSYELLTVVEGSNFVVNDPSNDIRWLVKAILLLDELPEIGNAIGVLDPDAQLLIFVWRTLMVLDVEHVQVDIFNLWNWQSCQQEWVKCDGDPVADGANECWLELAMEQITDDRFISVQMPVPSVETGLFVCPSLFLRTLNIWLLILLVKIFRHEIKNRVDAFRRVLLAISFKGHVVLTKDPLEKIWSDNWLVSAPHLANKLGPSLDNSSFSS